MHAEQDTRLVVPVSRTVDQKRAVSKASTTAIEPPFASIA